jgi:hypothetical protein
MSAVPVQLCLALTKRIVLAARAAKHNAKNVEQARARGGMRRRDGALSAEQQRRRRRSAT